MERDIGWSGGPLIDDSVGLMADELNVGLTPLRMSDASDMRGVSSTAVGDSEGLLRVESFTR